MFNKKLIIAAMTIACTLMMTSCGLRRHVTPYVMMPEAINTINSVRLDELNLKHGTDYTIVNTVTADATIIYSTQRKGKQVTISEENGEFKIVFKVDEETGKYYRDDFEGIARFGFLTNDYGDTYTDVIAPHYMVRNLAIYRIINAAKVRGADGIIEPVISTNVEQRGRDIVLKTTVSAKLIKLKTDAK